MTTRGYASIEQTETRTASIYDSEAEGGLKIAHVREFLAQADKLHLDDDVRVTFKDTLNGTNYRHTVEIKATVTEQVDRTAVQ